MSTMRASPRSPRLVAPPDQARGAGPAQGSHAAAALLGDRHPLVATLARLETIALRMGVVAALHILGLSLWWMQAPAGASLVMGSGALALVLGCRMMWLLASRREVCLELIATGHEGLPLAAVDRERDRLANPKHQAHLARSIERLARPQTTRRQPAAIPPLDARVMRSLAGQLEELARHLREEDVAPRAVALTEQLISRPTSPLYGSEADLLRRELGRVRYFA